MAPAAPNLTAITGKVFTPQGSTEGFGVIRAFGADPGTHPTHALGFIAFAEDSCGNAFVLAADGSIHFWDHETDDLTKLASDALVFQAGCHSPRPVELDPSRVESIWIDPEFAKKFGLKQPPKGP